MHAYIVFQHSSGPGIVCNLAQGSGVFASPWLGCTFEVYDCKSYHAVVESCLVFTHPSLLDHFASSTYAILSEKYLGTVFGQVRASVEY